MRAAKIAVALFLVASLFSMCKKDSKNDSTVSNTEYYVQGTLNGQKWNWQVPADWNGFIVGTSSSLSNDQGTMTGGFTALVSDNSHSFKPQLGIEFKTISLPIGSDGTTAFDNFFTTGTWSYASDLTYAADTKSIVISYTDNTGKTYSSIGLQNGSSLTVQSATPVSGSVYNADSGFKIKLSFSCILYPTDGTGSALAAENVEATVFLDKTPAGLATN
ncbi:MAG TPA: hypothetical protein VIM89_11395 [Mucilaginibacter sp.]